MLFLEKVAIEDVRKLYRCRTFEMFQYLAKLVLEGWIAAGEHELATTFGASYVHDDKFNKWYYCCSSVTGLIPTQNPTESVNLDIKGNRNMTGLVKLGTSTTKVLYTELPHMVNVHSTERVLQ